VGGYGEGSRSYNEELEETSISCCTVCTKSVCCFVRGKMERNQLGKILSKPQFSPKCINTYRFSTSRKETDYTTISQPYHNHYTTTSLCVQDFFIASNINKSEKLRWNIPEYLKDLHYKNSEIRQWLLGGLM
jgi:hypothetical protein